MVKEINDHEYLSDEPCRVCSGHNKNQVIVPFAYTVCKVHELIPPSYLGLARRQFIENGKTQWDINSS